MKLALDELTELETLKPDWDGEGAVSPSPVALASARRFLEALSQLGLPCMSACADGSIDAYWIGGKALLNFSVDGGMAFCSSVGGFKIKGGTASKALPVTKGDAQP